MSVYDRWHKRHPGPGDVPCQEHSRGKTKLYPTAEHLQGDRWQVRWRDEAAASAAGSFRKEREPIRKSALRHSMPSGSLMRLAGNGLIRVSGGHHLLSMLPSG